MGTLSGMRRKLQGWTEANGCHENADLRSMSAYGSSWTATTFSECRMNLADLSRSRLVNCTFERCDALVGQFVQATLDGCTFRDCNLEQASFAGAVLKHVTFSRCSMTYATFAGATLRENVKFLDCNLHGADLDFIEAAQPSFVGSNLWGAKVSLGCAFFDGFFDEAQADRFVAMIARIHPEQGKAERLKQMAGRHFGAVDRKMKRRIEMEKEDERESA